MLPLLTKQKPKRNQLPRSRHGILFTRKNQKKQNLPNPKQTGVIPNVRVSPEMIDAWKAFLDEMDAILKGKKLLAHWRIGNDGINLRRIFTEPTRLDLVLWLQGTAAKPYIEKGELTDQRVWRQLQQVFSGQFFGFAIWFN